MKNTINEYTDESGNSPYADWLGSLRDARAKAKVIMQVDKMELGLFGDSQPIGDGLSELRIHYGPGYRIYYGKEGQHKEVDGEWVWVDENPLRPPVIKSIEQASGCIKQSDISFDLPTRETEVDLPSQPIAIVLAPSGWKLMLMCLPQLIEAFGTFARGQGFQVVVSH